ncbi:hypothetical protein [Treponema primitia]|uniref:hypothetical protein n=1 Tax=Treponema primitia TaxID=88058 RepID=UPI0002E7F4D0|nr:hypothetical protein [Treponema primitia]
MAGNSSHSTAVTRVIYLDTRAPTVTVTNPPSTDAPAGPRAFFITPAINITGTAADAAPGSVVNILYFDGVDDATPPADSDSGWLSGLANGVTGTNGWQIVTDLTGAVEGNRRIWIKAQDQMGHRNANLTYSNSAASGTLSAASFPYAYDKSVPTLTEISITEDPQLVPGIFDLHGKVGDSNALRSLIITQTKDDDSAGDFTRTITLIYDGGTPDPNLKKLGESDYSGAYIASAPSWLANTNWSTDYKFTSPAGMFSTLPKLPLDKDGNHVEDTVPNKSGAYHYTITAIDITGKKTIVTKNVIIDIDPPTIALVGNRPDNAWYPGDATINGSAADTPASGGVDSVYYWIGSLATPAPTHAAKSDLINLTPTEHWRKASGSTGWSVYNITTVPDSSPAALFAEGEYHLYVIAADKAGNLSGALEYKFRIDRNAPTVLEKGAILTPNQKANFDLVLDIAESYKLDRIEIKQTFTPQGLTTSQAITVIKEDMRGKSGAELATLAPLLTANTYQLTNLPWDSSGASITLNTTTGADDGTYEYEITVYDLSSVVGTPDINLPTHKAVFTKTISVDTQAPELTVNSPHGSPSQPAYFSSSKLYIAGDATDAHPGPVYFWDGPELSSPGATPTTIAEAETAIGTLSSGWHKATGTSPSWVINYTIPDTDLQGSRYVRIIAFDTLGHKNTGITYTSENGTPTSTSFDFPYAIDFSDPQLSELTGNDFNRKPVAASFHLNGYVGDANGVRTITITQELQGSSDDAYNFTYELFNSWNDTTEEMLSGGAYLNGLNHAWKTDTKFNVNPATTTSTGFSLPIKKTGSATYVHADGVSGDFDYTIRATDRFGRTTTLTRRVQVDVDPPEIYFPAPGSPNANKPEDSWFNTTTNIRGESGNDLTGINSVYYWYGEGTLPGGTYTPPTPPTDIAADWSSASGTSPWSVPLDISENSFTEGYYTLFVIAVDGAGNIGGKKTPIPDSAPPAFTYPPLTYNFRVDKAKPTITETLVDQTVDVVYTATPTSNKSPLRKAAFDLSLALFDSHGLARLDIKQTKDGNTDDPLSLDFSIPLSGTTVTRVLGALPWTALDESSGAIPLDGVYEYVFTIWDATISDGDPLMHKSETITRKITVDNTKPSVAHISTPGELYQTMNAALEIRGNATDPSPGTIRRVLYWTGLATTTANASDVPAYTPTDPVYDPEDDDYATRPWKEVDYSTSGWSKEISLGNDEGQRVVAVIAEDKHGNVSDLKLYNYPSNTNNVSVRFFYKDDGAPRFDVTLPDTRSRVDRNPQFPMEGYIQDSNAVDKIVLVQKKMNGPLVEETLTFILNLNTADPYKKQAQYWRFAGLPYTIGTFTQSAITGNIGTGATEADAQSNRIIGTGTPYTGSGAFDYTITAYDVSGRTVLEQRSVTIDVTAPTAAISVFPANPAPDTWFSQTQLIRGTAVDTGSPQSGVANVYYAITAPLAATPAFDFTGTDWKPATAVSGWANWNITLQIDENAGSLDEGQYQLHVIAVDGAGNRGGSTANNAVTYLFNVDKSNPTISEITIGADVFKLATQFNLGGPYADTYQIDSIKITQTSLIAGTTITKTLKAYEDSSTFNTLAYEQIGSTWNLKALPRNPSLDNTAIKTPADWAIVDGVYTYAITAKDKAGKETTVTRIISVDSSAPTVTVSGPAVVASESWTGDATITVTGTATDAAPGQVADVYYWLADASVTVTDLNSVLNADGSFTGSTTWEKAQLISGTSNWSTVVPYTLPLEGKQKLVVYARDSANHFSTGVTKTFWVDQTDPTLTVTAKTADTPFATITGPTAKAVKLSGTAWDTNGIQSISIVQRKAGITTPLEVPVFTTTTFSGPGDGKSEANAKTWNMDSAENLPRQYGSPTAYDANDGTYTYYITLTDNAGRTKTNILEINVDKTAPIGNGSGNTITVSYPTNPIVGDVGTWVRGATVSVAGQAADAMPADPTGTITPSGIEKVIYWASINGASDLPVGLLDQAGINGWKTAGNYNAATTEWSATLVLADFGLGDGVNKLWVRAYDKAGNLSNAFTRTFGVDQANPALTEISVDTDTSSAAEVAYIRTQNFTLSGKAVETNIDKIVITQQVRLSDGTLVDSPITIATIDKADMSGLGSADNPRVWALATPVNQLPRKYGSSSNPATPITDFSNIDVTFIYKITAWDLMGNASPEITRLVTIDKSGPLVAILHPTPNASYQGTSIQIDGNVADGTRVDQVRYIIEPAATTLEMLKLRSDYPATHLTGWTAVEANKLVGTQWSAFIDFSALLITEGDLRLWVIASDGTNWGGSAETAGDPVSAAFTLDQAPPQIGTITYTGTSTVSRNIYAQAGFSFAFDAWDSNKLPDEKLTASVSITRSGTTLPLGAAQGVTISNGGASPDTVHVVVDQTGSYVLSEGTYTYVITVTDKAGKTTVTETTVIVDTTAPELSITSIIPVVEKTSGTVTTEYVNGLFWFNVSSSDDNGIYPYHATDAILGSPQGGVKYYFVPANTGGHPIANPFADTSNGTVLQPGPYRGVVNTADVTSTIPYTLWIYARDRAGRISSLSRNLTIDQITDYPVVNIPAMAGYNASTNIFTLNPGDAGYPLVGIVSDDDNVDGTKLKVYRTAVNPPATVPDGDWIELTAGTGLTELTQVAGSDKEWRFTYVVPKSLTDGTYKLRVVVEDKSKNYPYTNNQIPNNTADQMGIISEPAAIVMNPVYTFNVDAVKPVITVTNIEETYKTTQAITGTVKEATLRAFRVTIDGSRVVSAFNTSGAMVTDGELVLSGPGETKTWALNMASTAFNLLNDGPHSLLWTAEDAVGNTETLGRTFYKDSSGPDIIVTSLNEDQNYIIDSRGITNGAPFWYNPKTGVSTENDLKAVADVITDGTPKLTGTFFDEYSTVFLPSTTPHENQKFWYRFDYAGFSTDDTPASWKEATGETFLVGFNDLTGAEKSVRWQIPLSSTDPTSPSYGLLQGYHHVDIKVLDRWGTNNGMKYQAPGDSEPNVYDFERIAFRLDSLPPEITLTAKDGFNKAIADGDTFGNLSNPDDVVFKLLAKVTDVTLSSVKADIRVGNTILKKLGGTPTDSTYTTSLGTMGTEIIDNNTVKNLTINVSFTQADMNTLVNAASGLGSNVFTIVITATDGAPREQKLEVRFKTDSTPARITTSNLVTNRAAAPANYPTVIIDAQPTIQGNISDDSGIGVARYKIDKWDYSLEQYTSALEGVWTNLSASSDFANNFITMEAFTINLRNAGTPAASLFDGKYRISFNLRDKASPDPNVSSKINIVESPTSYPGDDIANIEFFIDGAPPALDTANFKSPPFYSGTEVTESSIDYMAVYLKATDDNTITGIRARMETDSSGTYPLTAAPYTDMSMPGVTHRLLIPKTQYAQGLHTLTIEAKDGAGRTMTITRDFTLDITKPMLQIIEPMPVAPDPLAEITSQATIRGITVDNNSVSKLYYLFGRTEVTAGTLAPASFPANTTAEIDGKIWREFNAGIDKDGNTIAAAAYITDSEITTNLDKAQGAGSLYNWTIKLPNSVDLTTDLDAYGIGRYVSLYNYSTFLCELPIRFMMIDSAGNIEYVNYSVIVNPKGDQPMVIIASPNPVNSAAQNEVGGVITVVGAAKDNDWIHRVVFRVINGDEPDTGSTHELPIYTDTGWTTDLVTNTNYTAAPYNDNRNGWYQATIVGTPGSTTQWSINLNNNGQLNAPSGGSRVVTIQVLAYDTPTANHNVAQTMGEIARVKVTFVDGLPFVVDNSVIITPEQKNGTPFALDDPSVTNKKVGGTINITAHIRDDNGLKELTWHGEDTTAWSSNILQRSPAGGTLIYAKPLNVTAAETLIAGTYYMYVEGDPRTSTPFLGSNPPAGLTYAAPALNHDGTPFTGSGKAYLDYEVSLTLDSTTLLNKNGEQYLNRAGTYTLSLLATDHTDFKMPASWSLQIDNFFPLGTYTGNGVAAGASYQLQGLAWDTGAGVTVQGIKKVVAWFSRGNTYIPLNERDTGAAFVPATGKITVAQKRNDANKDRPASTQPDPWIFTDINNGPSTIQFPNLTYTREYLDNGTPNPDYFGNNASNKKFISGIEIDKNEPTTDTDHDGFLEGLADAGMNYQWYARIDTTQFFDGLLTVHYLVYDQAGNASYYSNTIFISNNPPTVTSVDIGTDVLGVGNTTDTRGHRTVSANYENTNITVRNRQVSFKFNITGDLGARPFHYRFGYVGSRTSKSASALDIGEIYSITQVGTVNWEAVGAPEGYGEGTTFMATDKTDFGTGSADLLTIINLKANNIISNDLSDHVVTYTYSGTDFNTIPDAADNTAWFVLRVYNSLKIPMIPDLGAEADGGYTQQGPSGTDVYDAAGDFTIWDQPYDVVRIGLNVANSDTVIPQVKLWDLNPYGETAGVNGLDGINAASGTAAQPPSSVNLNEGPNSPNLLKGGLYNPRNHNRIIERSGHIEPRFAASQNSYFIEGNTGSAQFSKDTLSGKIILRGFAYDNQRLGGVFIKIGDNTEFQILQSDDVGSNSTRGLLVPASGQTANAWVYNQIDLSGHMAEWAYVWDTNALPVNASSQPIVVADNITVQVRVTDKQSTPNWSSVRRHPNTTGSETLGTNDGRNRLVKRNADGWRLDLADDLGYNRITVTLAPYINTLLRDRNSFRSRQGWYAFSRGERVVAQGWNIKNPSGSTTVTFPNDTTTTPATVSNQSSTAITFTVPNDAISGDIKLTANSVQTVNDRNINANPWNKEDYNLSIVGNDLWIDDRAAHIWRSDASQSGSDRGYFSGSEGGTDVAMTMNPANGILWGSWADGDTQGVYMNTNDSNTRIQILANDGGGDMDNTDIYFGYPQRSSSSNNTRPTMFYHNSRSWSGDWNQTHAGGLKGYDPAGGSNFDATLRGGGESHQYNAELAYHDKILRQFKNPRVVYRGDNIHVSYYDTDTKSMKYVYFKSGWSITSGNYNSPATASGSGTGTRDGYNSNGIRLQARHWINLDGTTDAEDIGPVTTGLNYDRVRAGAVGGTGYTFPRSSAAGQWSSIELQSGGQPVIAYYDSEAERLRIAYASTDVNPLKETWKVQWAMPDTDPNYSGAGEYVSMQIDQSNNDAHIAFFRGNSNQLIYLKLQWENGVYVPYGNSLIVDESSANGRWVDLTLDKNNRPWISYLDNTRTNNFDGVKMAYYDPTKYPTVTYDINGVLKTGWETMNVPAQYKIGDGRTSIEVWPHRYTTGTPATKPWAASIAYTNEDSFRIAYYLKPKN